MNTSLTSCLIQEGSTSDKSAASSTTRDNMVFLRDNTSQNYKDVHSCSKNVQQVYKGVFFSF